MSMRGFLFSLVLLIPMVSFAQRRYAIECMESECLVSPYYNPDNIFEDESVKIFLDLEPNFINIKIKNKTDNRIYVEWENARINDSKVIFDYDSPITMGLKKEDEVITAGRSSEYKSISSKSKYIGGKLYSLFKLKKHGSATADLVLPIRIGDKSVDYLLTTKMFKFNQQQVDSMLVIMNNELKGFKQVKKNMSYDQVVNIMGEPKLIYGEVGNECFKIKYNFFDFILDDMKVSKKSKAYMK